MKERLKELRKALKLTQGAFAEKLNLQQNTICLFETGRRNPSDRTIDDMCYMFSVSKEWLIEGKGDMFAKTPNSTMKQLKNDYGLNDFDYSFVYEYLKLDEEQRETIRKFFYNVVTSGKNMPAEELTRQKIEEEVEDYRRELELEAKGETLSAYEDTGETKNA